MTKEKAPECPHCGQPMKRWALPEDSTWPNDYHYVCFNDSCDYYVRGWEHMEKTQGSKCSYRHMCGPRGERTGPLPVPTPGAGRDRILDDPPQGD